MRRLSRRVLSIVLVLTLSLAAVLTTFVVSVLQTHAASPPITATGNGLGAPAYYTLATTRCGCYHKGVRVNVANGNLFIQASDLTVKGTGLDLSLASNYNNLAGTTGRLGKNWTLGTAGDIRLDTSGSSAVTYYGPDGYDALFTATGTTYTDAPGINATLTHKSDGTWSLLWHKTGEVWAFTATGSLTSDTDKNGNHLTFTYSGSHLTTITDTHGRATTLTYDGTGHVTTVTDSTNRTVKYGYDSNNHLTSSTDLAGKKTTFGYTGDDLTTITDPRSQGTTITYDSSHRVKTIKDALLAVTTFAYNTGMTTVTDGNNHATKYTYDSNDRVTNVVDAANHTRLTTYTPNSDVNQTTDALNQATNLTFDVNNNVMSITDATNAKTSYGYTDITHPYYATSQTDPQGNVLAYTYDAKGNLTKTQDGLTSQNTVTSTYNANGTSATTTDGVGHTTTYGYDSSGQLTTVTPPAPLGQTTLTYDSLSRALTVTDGKQQKTTYTYDALDRIKTTTFADTSVITYGYDENGNQTSVKDSTGTTSFTYDAVGQQTLKVLPDNTAFQYVLDNVGNLTSYAYAPCGVCSGYHTIGFTYNAVNLPTQATQDGNGTPLATFTYDNANRRTGVTYANNVTQTVGYDSTGRQTSIGAKKADGTVLTSFTYTYLTATGGTESVRASVTDKDGNLTTYGYDALNRLTNAVTKSSGGATTATYAYSYDGANNRTSATTPTGSTTYSYNTANELTSRVTNGSTTTSTYDANGNLTGETNGLTLAYNVLNQTGSVTPAGQGAQQYTYSGPNEAQRVAVNGTAVRYSKLGLYQRNPTDVFFRDNSGLLLAAGLGAGEYYYLFDALGSVVGLTDISGNLVQSYQYDPYGNVTNSTGSIDNPYQYASGYTDTATGLIQFGLRYYQPATGRWTQQDPLAGSLFDPSTGNRYAYANGNPVNLVDPTGLSILGSFGALVGGFIAGGLGVYVPFLLGAVGFTAPVAFPAIAVAIVTGILVGAIAQIAYNFVTSSGLV